MTISIIGTGNIGGAIANGLLQVAETNQSERHLILTRRNVSLLHSFKEKGAEITPNNEEAIKKADILLIALQPTAVIAFIKQYRDHILKQRPIIASIATNISLEDIRKALYPNDLVEDRALPIYRIMPNTAIAVRESMTCISRQNYTKEHDQLIESIFMSVGDVLFIQDDLMNAATVLCACGTAYALRYIRAASQGGTEIGFHADEALKLAAQTVKGAAELIIKTGKHPEQAIDQVTTPMGCTIAGMNEMEHQGFSSATIKGIRKSYERATDI